MLFNSYIFILLFLPVTLAGYYLLNHIKKYNWGLVWLFGMSLWFYGYFNARYLAIILISVCTNFTVGRWLYILADQKKRKILLAVGIILNIGGIFYFKYFDFFIENINILFSRNIPLKHILLPLGISFFTFQQISYIVDCYCDKTLHYGFLEYAVYVTFFPQLIAGPIVLHSELVPQLMDHSKKKVDYNEMCRGLYAFSLGLGKKVLLADTFSLFVNYGYSNITTLSSLEGVITMLFYTLQIYFDFSGYCDMALGIGYLFRITLPINFNSPYKAVSIRDFWDRWHMTLTRFFTHYIYIPLGGSKNGVLRTCVNTMIVFLISGLWHGAAWTFILWGILHGVLMVLNRLCLPVIKKIPKLLTGALTFLLVNLLWIFFRAKSVSEAVLLIGTIFTKPSFQISNGMADLTDDIVEMRILARLIPGSLSLNVPLCQILLFGVLGLFGIWFMKNTQEKVTDFTMRWTKYAVTVLLMTVSILSFSGVSEFLYFNF